MPPTTVKQIKATYRQGEKFEINGKIYTLIKINSTGKIILEDQRKNLYIAEFLDILGRRI